MGLDSVELLMEFEKFFGLIVPDRDAEKVITVGDMTELVSSQLQIESSAPLLREAIFRELVPLLRAEKEILLTDMVAAYLNPADKVRWNETAEKLRLSMPLPDTDSGQPSAWKQLFGMELHAATYNWLSISFSRFADCIAAANYTAVVDPQHIRSKHDVYIAIMGITAEKQSIDYYEILPEKSFTSDLGID